MFEVVIWTIGWTLVGMVLGVAAVGKYLEFKFNEEVRRFLGGEAEEFPTDYTG